MKVVINKENEKVEHRNNDENESIYVHVSSQPSLTSPTPSPSPTSSSSSSSSSPPTSIIFKEVPPNDKVVEPMSLQPSALMTRTDDCTSAFNDENNVSTNNKRWNSCPPSAKSMRTVNRIRAIVDPIAKKIQSGHQREDGKDPISLALGDPTAGGNLPPCSVAMEHIVQTVTEESHHHHHAAGYVNACGTWEARAAIAKFHSLSYDDGIETHDDNTTTTTTIDKNKDNKNENNDKNNSNRRSTMIGPENVIVANGCSHALELAISSLLDVDTILLAPQPGFPLYQNIVESHGATVVHYHLNPDRQWEIDMEYLRDVVMKHTNQNKIRGMIVNNPSNPTGSVFSKQHIIEILNFANEYQMPIIADEVYGDLTFGNNVFYPMAHVAAEIEDCHVPIITASGLAKQFLLPGWRVGWITFHDNVYGSLKEIEAGAKRLAQVILGASHLAQSVVPKLLSSSSDILEWRSEIRQMLEKQATYLCTRLDVCQGLDVVPPQGSMYAMIKLDLQVLDVKDDLDFSTQLLEEENVFVLPGSAFGASNVFRVVFCPSESTLGTAADRIENFCNRHVKKTTQ